jgi:hypothetical protein
VFEILLTRLKGCDMEDGGSLQELVLCGGRYKTSCEKIWKPRDQKSEGRDTNINEVISLADKLLI